MITRIETFAYSAGDGCTNFSNPLLATEWLMQGVLVYETGMHGLHSGWLGLVIYDVLLDVVALLGG